MFTNFTILIINASYPVDITSLFISVTENNKFISLWNSSFPVWGSSYFFISRLFRKWPFSLNHLEVLWIIVKSSLIQLITIAFFRFGLVVCSKEVRENIECKFLHHNLLYYTICKSASEESKIMGYRWQLKSLPFHFLSFVDLRIYRHKIKKWIYWILWFLDEIMVYYYKEEKCHFSCCKCFWISSHSKMMKKNNFNGS